MKLFVDARTDQGRVRSNNEDNLYIDHDTGLLVVADGMGGHASGEVASKMAVDVIRDSFNEPTGKKDRLIGKYDEEFSAVTNKIGSAIRLANMAIYEASQINPRWKGMGTTIVTAMINDGRLSIAHVGDSRIYLVRAGAIEQLTDDHSLVYEQVKRDMMTKEEAELSEMKNVLTRALGTQPEVAVDLDELTLAHGDALVLCTDGLTTMVSDDDILSVVMSLDDPGVACERLVDMANDNGGKDNVTVIVAYLRKSGWLSALFNIFK